MQRALSCLLLVIAAGCGGARAHGDATTRVASDPCRGADLTLQQALVSCRVAAAPAPPAASDVRVTADPVEVRGGETARVWLTFENATDAPREIGFASPPSFSTSIWNGDERADQRFDGFSDLLVMMSPCMDDDCRPIAVTLEPRGRLRAYVDVPARVVVLTATEDEEAALDESDGGPIAPGSYEIHVALPWTDAGETPGRAESRVARAPFIVTP